MADQPAGAVDQDRARGQRKGADERSRACAEHLHARECVGGHEDVPGLQVEDDRHGRQQQLADRSPHGNRE